MNKDQKHKILIVDDDDLNVEIIEEILDDDFEFRSASNGTEALEIAAFFLPDLILLDIMMPDIDGYEVCRQIRNNQKLSLTKIILLSAKQLVSDRLDGYRSGADDYISKPFDPEELIAKINVFLRLKSVEEIEKVKSDLLSVFSHETKTPLHTIVGFATLLMENKTLSNNEKEALSHIMKSGEDMLDLIEKTILLSNLRSGNKELRNDLFNIERLIGMAAERVSCKSEFDDLEIKSKLSDNQTIIGDEELLVTALACLFESTIKYSNNNFNINISTSLEEDSYKIMLLSKGTTIPESNLKTLFSAFLVFDVSHHGRESGLDLSLVKHIIEKHDGHISVKNDNKELSTMFTITLPISRILIHEQ